MNFARQATFGPLSISFTMATNMQSDPIRPPEININTSKKPNLVCVMGFIVLSWSQAPLAKSPPDCDKLEPSPESDLLKEV
jgi:hypothetical protein